MTDKRRKKVDDIPEEIVLQSREYAQRFVSLTEELMKRGVPEQQARIEARGTALTIMLDGPQSVGEVEEEMRELGIAKSPCPVCGQPMPSTD